MLTGIATGIAGPALVLMFLLNGLITVLTAMSYAGLGSAFPEAGGGYLWVKEDMGGAQVIGATNKPLFKNLLMGNISERIAREARVTVIMVKRRSRPLHSFLRRTVLAPTTREMDRADVIQYKCAMIPKNGAWNDVILQTALNDGFQRSWKCSLCVDCG